MSEWSAALAEFHREFPGWWYTSGLCYLTAHCSIGPDYNDPAHRERLLAEFPPPAFDRGGFDADLPPPATCADALRDCMDQARAALSDAPADVVMGR